MATGANDTGTIILARHGEPDLSRKARMSASEYVEWWAIYEETGLMPGQIAPAALIAHCRPRRRGSIHPPGGAPSRQPAS